MATSHESPDEEAIAAYDGGHGDVVERARAAYTAVIIAVVIGGLYFGREVLVPIAFAVLLSFVLAPLADALRRLHLGHALSVFLSVFMAFAILVGLGGVIGKQVAELAGDLPAYQRVINNKIESLRTSDLATSLMERASGLLHFNPGQGPSHAAPAAPAGPAETPPLPVEVRQPALGPIQILESILSALLPPLTTAAIVVVFVIFILLQQRDLRDRLIKLIGAHDLHRTTKALDDAAMRLSRYFTVLTAINTAFGLIVAGGLAFIGVPNPILWGIFAGVIRFLPYIGAFIGAAFPMAIAAAVAPGWTLVFETGLMFLVLESVTGQLIEPHVFGHTTGMSPLAVIVAAAFWTLIWGPPGLLLSTPITACLVVLGRHIESLNFIELLLGDRPPLSPEQSLYQRILASDPDEATLQAERLFKSMPLVDYYENVAMPALALAQADVDRGVLEPHRQAGVYASVAHLIANLADHVDVSGEGEAQKGESAVATLEDGEGTAEKPPERRALCVAGRTPLDQAACAILVQLLEREHVPARMVGPQSLSSNGAPPFDAKEIGAIAILYLDALRIASVRYSVRRLRKRFPGTPIVVCVWGASDLSEPAEISDADSTVASLHEAVDFCVAATESTPADDAMRARAEPRTSSHA
ncbi:MAG TPA: AI-2E family transporter [Roseiarcus sp.]|jgi:predicted PurR-regulated permease PerM